MSFVRGWTTSEEAHSACSSIFQLELIIQGKAIAIRDTAS